MVAFYRKPINANDKARINDIVNTHRNRIFTADAIGQYWNAFFAWPTKIVEWKGLTGIVIPFYDKSFSSAVSQIHGHSSRMVKRRMVSGFHRPNY